VDAEQDEHRIVCATYTHARRHPLVLGQIGGWTPPFQLTLTQIGVLLVALFLEVRTWRWWGAHLPRVLAVVAAVGVPALLAWAVRRARIEGRSVPRAALAWFIFLLTPRRGRVGGRPDRPARPGWPGGAPVYVAAGGRAR
jgi:hypothetical protein